MKLIRHKIPTIAHTKGERIRVRRVTGPEELRQLLGEKLVEEAREFAAAPSIDELVDVQEAIRCLLVANGWSRELLEGRWAHKRRERGGLSEGIVFLGDHLKPGARVLIVHKSVDRSNECVVLRAEVLNDGDHTAPLGTDSFPWFTFNKPRIKGSCPYDSEGVTWARGWDDETAGALAAAWALAEPK